MDYGLWIMDFGLWIMDYGFWILDYGSNKNMLENIKTKTSDLKQDINISIAEVSESNLNPVNNIDNEKLIHSHKLSKKLKWKVNLMILPFFMVTYFLQFLDKTLLNYASIMGIKKNLVGNEFSNLGTIFYVSYIAAEPFSAFIIQKIPAGRFLGFSITCWGIVVACHAATTSYVGLMIVRVLLGIFEAPVAPCLIIISSKWFTKPEQARRTFFWYAQTGIAQIVGSLMSFGFQHVHHTKIASWQIMFIFMGAITVIVGILVFILLPDNPLECKFLSEDEKMEVVEHIKENQTGIEDRSYKFHQVKELLLEKETWVMFFIIILSATNGGGLTVFSSQIMKTFGFSNEISALVQMPGAFFLIASTFVCCYLPSYTGQRSLMIAAVTIPTILGAALYMGLPNSNKVGKLFGVYLLNFNGAVIASIYAWNSANTAGYTKKNARNAMTLIAFCIGNIIGPQIFRAEDAPLYKPAKIIILAFLAAAFVLSIILRYFVRSENKRRDILTANYTEEEKNKDVLMLDLTDRENLNFRYAY
ncbi:hypothetical protein C6P40_001384 [Pichia californica]|uniref:Major facilitator superfamily (MFS) profile domain-containing protein n=1 Tax=Pichia californica TaxID=460514 RepID=A0A9P7BGC3_9ASCO|nr:hypothetical protein C6P42_003541 [[Candida] californica]KAG0688128.1 hypothetical protein C6P40_001384 [[Candida] californica]